MNKKLRLVINIGKLKPDYPLPTPSDDGFTELEMCQERTVS